MSELPSERAAPGSTVGTLVYLLAGPIVWTLHFGFIYGYHGLVCVTDRELPGSAQIIGSGIVTATAIAVLVIVTLIAFRKKLQSTFGAASWDEAQRAFQRSVMGVLAGLSMFAVIAESASAWFLAPCSPL